MAGMLSAQVFPSPPNARQEPVVRASKNDLLQRGIESTAVAIGASVEEVTQRNIEAIARMERESEAARTRGEWLADWFATIVGSWTFIIAQSVLLLIWLLLNLSIWTFRWDPYPFILLNLVLAFDAAFASPIIMMSQNRQGRLADKRNRLDLQINLLAEQENTELLLLVRKLCEKAGVPLESHPSTGLDQETSTKDLARQIDEAASAKPIQSDKRPPNPPT
jgi:uncharacterized membrane protein